jgi:hypothetical protein
MLLETPAFRYKGEWHYVQVVIEDGEIYSFIPNIGPLT